MKLWIGKEKEGVHQGFKTLFIGSPDVTEKSIIKFAESYNVAQIYFGAGICTEINCGVVFKCINYFENKDMLITLETDIKDFDKLIEFSSYKNTEFILTVTHKNFSILNKLNDYKTQIKVQSLKGDKVVALTDWTKFKKVDINKLKGKTYEGDVVLIE